MPNVDDISFEPARDRYSGPFVWYLAKDGRSLGMRLELILDPSRGHILCLFMPRRLRWFAGPNALEDLKRTVEKFARF
jgi:hypothetical protein